MPNLSEADKRAKISAPRSAQRKRGAGKNWHSLKSAKTLLFWSIS
jgi:hypothetical protein